MMDRRQLMAQALAAAPVQRREFPIAPEPAIPPGVPAMQNQGSGFRELDTTDPTALLMLRGGAGQTVQDTGRLYGLASDAALNFAGTTPMRGVQGVRAYHGSPHDFDRFDMRRIGTGEGFQAYGHGLYFADAPEVAETYRRNLSHGKVLMDAAGNRVAAREAGSPLEQVAYWWGQAGMEPDNIRRFLPDLAPAVEQAQQQGWRLAPNPGRMYEVNLRVDPNRLLDWDAPLSQQPAQVRDLLDANNLRLPKRERGQGIYAEIGANIRTPGQAGPIEISRNATEQLRNAGIPGIRYLDQGSRAAGDGTRNYVMFDDSLIEILRKYGWAGLGLALGVGGASQAEAADARP